MFKMRDQGMEMGIHMDLCQRLNFDLITKWYEDH